MSPVMQFVDSNWDLIYGVIMFSIGYLVATFEGLKGAR